MNQSSLDERDKEILKVLAAEKKCQYRLITDGGEHYIFCGAYFKRPAFLIGEKWLCKFCQKRIKILNR